MVHEDLIDAVLQGWYESRDTLEQGSGEEIHEEQLVCGECQRVLAWFRKYRRLNVQFALDFSLCGSFVRESVHPSDGRVVFPCL